MMFQPREPELLRHIFENVGYEFPDDTFKKLWNIGLEKDKTGLVCIDTFKKLLKESVPLPKLVLAKDKEVTC